jgi:putative hydrolase of the HAD superfamily
MTSRRAVVFDATGTLFEATESVGEVYARVAREHGVDLPAWRLDDGFRRIIRHAGPRGLEGEGAAARREGEVVWWFEIIRQTFQATDSTARFAAFPAFATALFDAYRAPGTWRLRPGVRDALTRLANDGVPLGVVSNFDHRLTEIFEQLGIHHFFGSIQIPSRVGAAKPDARIFEAAARDLDFPLDALVYVGDDAAERLEAIERLGVRVIDVRSLSEPARLAGEIAAVLTRPGD